MAVLHPVSGAPRPSSRQGIALCLSGGGFRASLFHLGALRRLNELGILRQVETICSVSGGSIIAAHLAKATCEIGVWPIPVNMWDEKVAVPFFNFVGKGVRTSILLRKYLPWNVVLPRRRVQWLEEKYHSELTHGMTLSELPNYPRFLFCATDLGFGDTWVFSSNSIGNQFETRHYDGEVTTFPVARAVAASSCFPPVFCPLRLAMKHSESSKEKKWQPFVLLSDGGVCDNMGVDPVWEKHQSIIVSDGGSPFRFSGYGFWTPWRWLKRVGAIVQQQSSAIRKKWLVSEFRKGNVEGCYWGIAGGKDAYWDSSEEPAYSRDLAESVLSRIRTDLNVFSRAERGILENHGYMLANAASKTYLKPLIDQAATFAVHIPHPEWLGEGVEDHIREQLRNSHRRIVLRGFLEPTFHQPLEGET